MGLFRLGKNGGVIRRWIVVTLLATVVLLIIACTVIFLSQRANYLSLAQQDLAYRARSLVSMVPTSGTTLEERTNALVGLVEDFSMKDRYELMLLDRNGNAVVTSSGFAYDAKEPRDDFYLALQSEDGTGNFVGYSANDEHIVAHTHILSTAVGDITALRLVSSISRIDVELETTAYTMVVICFGVLLLTIFSGGYFVQSIVIPLSDIGQTARHIAKGDYDVRIENKYNDEIGDLCDTINEMAQGLSETERLKNEFISSVSHELRTPLTAIKGWGDTLAAIGTKDEENFRKGLGIILSETDRLAVMVEDLLDFSRLQTGSMKVTPEPLDLREVLSSTAALMEQRALRAGIRLSLYLPEEPCTVSADGNRLRQVFSNLMDNAVKYSRKDDAIEVTLFTEDGTAKVRITDTGAGIPAEELPHITDRFFKASNAVTGSGIGLAVVKEIVSLHGGEMHIESELGVGTTVSVELPLFEG